MVDFVRLQQVIRERLEQDKTIRSVEVEGATREAAVAVAAALLNIPVRRLEYEIIERGFAGFFFGTGQKNWKIRAYERMDAPEEEKIEFESGVTSGEGPAEGPVIEDKDGEVFVQFCSEGVLLKVTPPQGKGRQVTEDQAVNALSSRRVMDINDQLVSSLVKQAADKYVLVGKFAHNPADDAFVSVIVPESEMEAFVHVNPPGPAGCDISVETLMNVLQSNRVVFGINTEFLRQFADKPTYKKNIQVAAGSHPINGRDSYLRYNFETEHNKVRIHARADGRVDFKDLNIIQNVVKGQPLAKKVPSEEGIAGKTVTGRILPAKNGKDMPLPLGNNVLVADDGVTIIANINGQVVLAAGKINVEPVYVVQGNVDIKTGNIIFLGNVVVKGNVEDGFSVKAAGNIEVNGTVERADMDAEGDIIVRQGITGKSGGMIKAGCSLWARFIENAIIEAGNMVVVSDGIINSQVAADKQIICRGKRAHIVGGCLRAAEVISAKNLGSPTSGTETICEVGFDPKSKEQLDKHCIRRDSLTKELEEIHRNLQTLIALKKQQQSLPENKEGYLQELLNTRKDMLEELQRVTDEIQKFREFLDSLKNQGRISVSGKVYPGVRITIRDIKVDVHSEYKAVTFILENGLIRVTPYEQPDEAVKGERV
ncbi:MAG: FapA family protein [Treponema sp.]|jgi:uncharacterized protein (DUF342 family)|nr:FapA family protein [Treponema sp.]